MFFETWWQGLIFGVVTSVGMLAVAYALGAMWKQYEDVETKKHHGCDAHH
ncbi:MAG: hypothetical protein ACOY46_11785 [Bacillota bacterium]